MRRLLLETSISKIHMIILLFISTLIIGSYFSYAMFTGSKEKKNAIRLVTGNLTGTLKVDGVLSDKLVIDANTTKTFTVELSNNNNRMARYNFYYIGTLPSEVEVGYGNAGNTPPPIQGVNLSQNGSAGSTHNYKIKVKNNSSTSITINLGYQVGLDYNDLALPSNAHLFDKVEEASLPLLATNMIAVTYDESKTSWVKADTNSAWYNPSFGVKK